MGGHVCQIYADVLYRQLLRKTASNDQITQAHDSVVTKTRQSAIFAHVAFVVDSGE